MNTQTNEVVVSTRGDAIDTVAVTAAIGGYIARSKAESTLRAYRSDWRHFRAWCGTRTPDLPATPDVIAGYIAWLAGSGSKVATITRRMAAISKFHSAAGHDSPCAMRHAIVAETLHGIKRVHGTAQKGKPPLLTVQIRRAVGSLPDTLMGFRDRAMVLVGFAGGFRRSELAALSIEDIEFAEEGLKISLRRSKTDQEGAGRIVGLAYGSDPATCPVRCLRRWLQEAGITSGSIFLSMNRHGALSLHAISPQTVRLIVQRCCQSGGLDGKKFSAHSLRSGMATQAAFSGASERSIMAQTGHRSTAMVRRYIRDGSLFQDNASASLGL